MSDTRDLLPEMLDPTDVCSAMDDLAFMEYCYSHFDVNHDHKVGLHEARAVREIDLSDSKVVSLRGIEYFTNLERLILDRSLGATTLIHGIAQALDSPNEYSWFIE